MDDPANLIDLARYPVHDPDAAPARRVAAEGRAQLAATGLCLLPGFLAPGALAAVTREARALEREAFRTESLAYGDDDGNPEKAFVLPVPARNAKRVAGYDMLGPDSAIRRLYEWDGLAALIRAILGVGSLHRCADPYVSCLLAYFGDGDELGWHFDPNDGSVTLLLQEAEAGGAFEYVPDLRREGREAVARVIDSSDRARVRTAALLPGTLSIFNGVSALHRVTRVAGAQPRIMLTMSFDEAPGKVFGERITRRFASRGRAA